MPGFQSIDLIIEIILYTSALIENVNNFDVLEWVFVELPLYNNG